MSIHEQLKAAGCEIHNHESDLYVPVDEISAPIVNAWEFKNQVERFPDATNGRLMYCLPFAYDPYWNRLEDRCRNEPVRRLRRAL